MRFLLLFLLLLLTACQSSETPAPAEDSKTKRAAAPSVAFLAEPMDPVVVETAPEALAVWRTFKDREPALLLLSNDAFLQPLPPSLQSEAMTLVKKESAETLRQKSDPQRPDPVMLPGMTVRAALDASFVSEIIWALPTDEGQQLSLERFREQLTSLGILDGKEAAALSFADGRFTGTVQGRPFTAAPLSALPALPKTLLVHLDLSYFAPLYKNEIKTPLFPLVHQSLQGLKEKEGAALAVTLSLSNLSGELPLGTRFLGDVVASFFRAPALFDEAAPANWKRRADMLYLESFFQPEKILELGQALVADASDDASAHFALYQAYAGAKQGEQALASLSDAVRLDRAYALEYLQRAAMAQEKKRPDEAARMLRLAHEAFPANPFIRLHLAQSEVSLGRPQVAVEHLLALESLPWSPLFFPEMRIQLKAMREGIETDGVRAGKSPSEN